jgi:large subunit ribosomal protein L24
MKTEWSNKWVSSTQPRKQRKYRANAPIHIKRKYLKANLDTKLKKEFKKRNLPIKKGDEVFVKRGIYKGKHGKIVSVQLKKTTVHIDSIKQNKVNGQEYLVPIQVSNLQIIKLNLEDSKRIKKETTKQKKEKTTEKKETKKTTKQKKEKITKK